VVEAWEEEEWAWAVVWVWAEGVAGAWAAAWVEVEAWAKVVVAAWAWGEAAVEDGAWPLAEVAWREPWGIPCHKVPLRSRRQRPPP